MLLLLYINTFCTFNPPPRRRLSNCLLKPSPCLSPRDPAAVIQTSPSLCGGQKKINRRIRTTAFHVTDFHDTCNHSLLYFENVSRNYKCFLSRLLGAFTEFPSENYDWVLRHRYQIGCKHFFCRKSCTQGNFRS
jgi:hypothetical protein